MATLPINTTGPGWNFDNSYARLPERLFARVPPTPVRSPRLVLLNEPLARELGLDPDWLASKDGLAVLAGNAIAEGSEPIAQAYAGHQFGHFTMLGDGRAHLLGEQIAPDGRRFDIQLKGSGPTPFSRSGDGRAALGPMLREHLVSEAMHALGIPTTRGLAVVATGEPVLRDSILPGAVLVRVATSHLRVGTFQFARATGAPELLQAILAHAIARHDPDIVGADNAALALLGRVMARQAALVARWMAVGFVHGVMNTDNMSIAGETIDYGPCAFMDRFDPATVFSSIDRGGRYAYANQPLIAQWNLVRLAEALLPAIDADEARAVEMANEAVNRFPAMFEAQWLRQFRGKLGLFTEEEGDRALIEDLLAGLHEARLDYTASFAALARGGAPAHPALEAWAGRHEARLGRQAQSGADALKLMQSASPAAIP
ncbi:MAG: protein adenylyltransferase SelO, partial [Thermaurantiacus sp.]